MYIYTIENLKTKCFIINLIEFVTKIFIFIFGKNRVVIILQFFSILQNNEKKIDHLIT
jgi:hypothetical protein